MVLFVCLLLGSIKCSLSSWVDDSPHEQRDSELLVLDDENEGSVHLEESILIAPHCPGPDDDGRGGGGLGTRLGHINLGLVHDSLD